MRQCPFCKEEIHEQATRCPKCRGDVGKHDMYHKPMSAGMIVFLILGGLAAGAVALFYLMATNATG